jgi:hypothetical protein
MPAKGLIPGAYVLVIAIHEGAVNIQERRALLLFPS